MHGGKIAKGLFQLKKHKHVWSDTALWVKLFQNWLQHRWIYKTAQMSSEYLSTYPWINVKLNWNWAVVRSRCKNQPPQIRFHKFILDRDYLWIIPALIIRLTDWDQDSSSFGLWYVLFSWCISLPINKNLQDLVKIVLNVNTVPACVDK